MANDREKPNQVITPYYSQIWYYTAQEPNGTDQAKFFSNSIRIINIA